MEGQRAEQLRAASGGGVGDGFRVLSRSPFGEWKARPDSLETVEEDS